MLKYFIQEKYINIDLINTFYKYITSEQTDPCSETYNREDIIILINKLY